MPRRLLYASRFPDELSRAIAWYDKQSPALRERFKAAVRKTIARIEKNPATYAVCFYSYRAARAKPFPYVVLYRFDDRALHIVGIVHAASDPQGWNP